MTREAIRQKLVSLHSLSLSHPYESIRNENKLWQKIKHRYELVSLVSKTLFPLASKKLTFEKVLLLSLSFIVIEAKRIFRAFRMRNCFPVLKALSLEVSLSIPMSHEEENHRDVRRQRTKVRYRSERSVHHHQGVEDVMAAVVWVVARGAFFVWQHQFSHGVLWCDETTR